MIDVFGLFKRKDETIVQLLTEIDRVARTVPAGIQQVSTPIFARLTQEVKTKWIGENIATYKALIQQGQSHEAFIYNFVVNAAGDKLESGDFHIYRGVLNYNGGLYKQLFEHCINTMVSAGVYTKEWASENLRDPVYEGIKDVG